MARADSPVDRLDLPGMLYVVGGPGTGKTALAVEIAREALRRAPGRPVVHALGPGPSAAGRYAALGASAREHVGAAALADLASDPAACCVVLEEGFMRDGEGRFRPGDGWRKVVAARRAGATVVVCLRAAEDIPALQACVDAVFAAPPSDDDALRALHRHAFAKAFGGERDLAAAMAGARAVPFGFLVFDHWALDVGGDCTYVATARGVRF